MSTRSSQLTCVLTLTQLTCVLVVVPTQVAYALVRTSLLQPSPEPTCLPSSRRPRAMCRSNRRTFLCPRRYTGRPRSPRTRCRNQANKPKPSECRHPNPPKPSERRDSSRDSKPLLSPSSPQSLLLRDCTQELFSLPTDGTPRFDAGTSRLPCSSQEPAAQDPLPEQRQPPPAPGANQWRTKTVCGLHSRLSNVSATTAVPRSVDGIRSP